MATLLPRERMRSVRDQIRDLHVGQLVVALGVLVFVSISLWHLREDIADRPRQRLVAYFAPVQAQAQAQLAILRSGGSIAEVNAATVGMTQRARFPGMELTNEETLMMAGIAIAIATLSGLALMLLWVWFGGRKATRRSRHV